MSLTGDGLLYMLDNKHPIDLFSFRTHRASQLIHFFSVVVGLPQQVRGLS
jgi:hypothetical protein